VGAAVDAFVAFVSEHLRSEEREVLPLAQAWLTADDWAAVDAAFEGNTDPLLGTEPGEHWEQVFRRIVNLAPPPIGVGPVTAPDF
jgi:hemerythrin-like domain-containing protein